jgi:anti-sigma-K factor RskA
MTKDIKRRLLGPTTEEENAELRRALALWRAAAVLSFVAAVFLLVILFIAHREPRRAEALPIKGMIVCLTLSDVAKIKANGGVMP